MISNKKHEKNMNTLRKFVSKRKSRYDNDVPAKKTVARKMSIKKLGQQMKRESEAQHKARGNKPRFDGTPGREWDE